MTFPVNGPQETFQWLTKSLFRHKTWHEYIGIKMGCTQNYHSCWSQKRVWSKSWCLYLSHFQNLILYYTKLYQFVTIKLPKIHWDWELCWPKNAYRYDLVLATPVTVAWSFVFVMMINQRNMYIVLFVYRSQSQDFPKIAQIDPFWKSSPLFWMYGINFFDDLFFLLVAHFPHEKFFILLKIFSPPKIFHSHHFLYIYSLNFLWPFFAHHSFFFLLYPTKFFTPPKNFFTLP